MRGCGREASRRCSGKKASPAGQLRSEQGWDGTGALGGREVRSCGSCSYAGGQHPPEPGFREGGSGAGLEPRTVAQRSCESRPRGFPGGL